VDILLEKVSGKEVDKPFAVRMNSSEELMIAESDAKEGRDGEKMKEMERLREVERLKKK
jgi:hypothetical protein